MSRPKSKAKPATSKEKVPAQDAEPASDKEFEVPLGLLCDMAWRVARANTTRPIDRSAWCSAVRDAYRLICNAESLRQGFIYMDRPKPWVEHAEKTIRSLATEDEYLEQHFTFERGCQLITGKRKDDAIALFRRACERDYLLINQGGLKELETEGFPWDRVVRFRASFVRIPKPMLRKNNSQKQSGKSFFE